jgi:hypothetical protein
MEAYLLTAVLEPHLSAARRDADGGCDLDEQRLRRERFAVVDALEHVELRLREALPRLPRGPRVRKATKVIVPTRRCEGGPWVKELLHGVSAQNRRWRHSRGLLVLQVVMIDDRHVHGLLRRAHRARSMVPGSPCDGQ